MKKTAYQLISEYYGDKVTARSGVKLIQHIDEGIKVLDFLGSCQVVKDAYALHPMFQNDNDLYQNWYFLSNLDPHVVALVIEYRKTANACLSDSVRKMEYSRNGPPELQMTNWPTLSPIRGVNDMLIADKVQNRKDFEIYHKGKHARSDELDYYFKAWLRTLNVSEEGYQGILECLK